MNANDFEVENMIRSSKKHNIVDIIIPEGVTGIESFAFKIHPKLMINIILPNSVTYIQDYAFAGCRSLRSVTIPKSVNEIGIGAFWQCINLEYIICHDISVPYIEGKTKMHKVLKLISERDLSITIPSVVKYMVIWNMFYQNPEDAKIYNYIIRSFSKMFELLIDENNSELITKALYSQKFSFDKNIDKFIQYANQKQKHEIQLLLMDYKYQQFEFKNPADKLKL